MADNPYVNKVELADGTMLIDIRSDTVTPETLLIGVTAHDKSGAPITGTFNMWALTVDELKALDL